MNDTTRRKQLLYRAESRIAATHQLVHRSLNETTDARVILFHESISEVVTLYNLLRGDGLPVVMEHSQLPSHLREETLELFRSGTAQVIVSARSLIEGFNVPEADLGIIVASSSSPRQRIQSIGRVLRTYRNQYGETKTSRVCILYVRDSVDEHIYEREDWDDLVGLDRNCYFHWNPPEEPLEMHSPPRTAVPREEDIEFAILSSGDDYPGRYEGNEFSTDSQGNVTDPEGQVAVNPQGIPKLVQRLKGSTRPLPRNWENQFDSGTCSGRRGCMDYWCTAAPSPNHSSSGSNPARWTKSTLTGWFQGPPIQAQSARLTNTDSGNAGEAS